MHLTQIDINNFRGIRNLSVQLDRSLTVFAGVNGAGKSSILDAIALMLSWPTQRILSPKGNGKSINKVKDIRKGAPGVVLGAKIQLANGEAIQWTHASADSGKVLETKSDYHQVHSWAQSIQALITESNEACSIPLFVYYPVNRAILDIPLRIRDPHDFRLVNALDDSLKGLSNFRIFFEWFRNQQELENDQGKELGDLKYQDRALRSVREALAILLPGYANVSVRRSPLRMVVKKNGEELRIDHLSDGEKCLFALVGDLARRLAMANPTMGNPLDGNAIVLIDEVDLHLHPAWQRKIVPQLLQAFPNVQFIVTTHSPQVIGETQGIHVRMLNHSQDAGIQIQIPSQSFGLSNNQIIDELMQDSFSRNQSVQEKLHQISTLIDRNQFHDAQSLVDQLKIELQGDIPELVEAEALIASLQAIE